MVVLQYVSRLKPLHGVLVVIEGVMAPRILPQPKKAFPAPACPAIAHRGGCGPVQLPDTSAKKNPMMLLLEHSASVTLLASVHSL